MRPSARAAFHDHYAILGVGVDATEAEIKAAFRERAKQCHPDLHPGDAAAVERFRRISEARRVLLSASARARFDLERLEQQRQDVVGGIVALVVRRAEAARPAPVRPRVELARPGWRGALLVLGGILTVLLSVSVLPLVTITGGPVAVGVSGFDSGAWAGVLNGAVCALVAVLAWVSWQGADSRHGREALLAVTVVWLLLVTAAELDPHVLLGGLFGSDLALAAGARLLPVGVGLTVCGGWLLRPPPAHSAAGQPGVAAPERA
jgi:DnaJ domain